MQKRFLVVSGSLFLSLVIGLACQSSTDPAALVADTGLRAPASFYESGFESEFMLMLSHPDSSNALRTNYLERLLKIQYRAEAHVEEFEENLEAILAKQKADPGFTPDPLDHDAYRRLRTMWMLSEKVTHELTYFYRRMQELSRDQRAQSDQRARAVRVLEDAHKWLDTRPEEDRLELIELFETFTEIKHQTDQASGAGRDAFRATASTFNDLAYLSPSELEARFKARRGAIRTKAREALSWRDPEIDRLYSEMRTEVDRAPASPKIFPSAGSQGNTLGREFRDGTFSLTYDDGPGPKSTQRLHGVLKSHNDPVNPKGAPASFFFLAKNALRFPQVIAATKRLGFPMDNHSWSHALFSRLSQGELRHEIAESTAALQKAFGYRPRFFRCPYGACYAPAIPAARQLIADQKMIHAYWQIDSLDWKNIGQPERTAEIVIKQMQATKKGIILMHDIHESSVDASKLILNWIKSQNQRGGKMRLKDLEAAVDEVNSAK